jgi:hypothetical protein
MMAIRGLILPLAALGGVVAYGLFKERKDNPSDQKSATRDLEKVFGREGAEEVVEEALEFGE